MKRVPFVFRGVGCGAAAAILALAACIGPGQSAAAKSSAGQVGSVTARVKFQRVPGTWFWNSDRYVLARSASTSGASNREVLIDDRTGRRRQVVFGDRCVPATIGAGTVALLCESGLTPTQEMYDIATGQTRTFVPSPSLVQPPLSDACGSLIAQGAVSGAGVVSIGTRWVALDTGSFDPHSFEQFAVQDRQTGQVRCVPSDAHSTVDLNSTEPITKVCPPLTVPVVPSSLAEHGFGSMAPLGDGFELAAGANSYLERCGTRLHEFLTSNHYQESSPVGTPCPAVACTLPANRHVIVWPGRGTVRGMWLPSRQRFTIPVPVNVDPSHGADASYQVGLTGRHLYLSTVAHLWQAPIPAQPDRSR